MLTWTELADLCRRGELRLWLPSGFKEVPPDGRALYMRAETFEKIVKRPWPGARPGEPAARIRDRRSAMRMVLERFVKGNYVALERDIAELGSKIRRPAHRGWWEFRSGPPDVQTRLFGFFARPGAFVATELLTRDGLDFSAQHPVCVEHWNSIAGGRVYMTSPYPVENGDDLVAYLGG